MKNAFFVFLFLVFFWGGMCAFLFSIKVGLIVGLLAGVLGVFYYSIIVVGAWREKEEEKNI